MLTRLVVFAGLLLILSVNSVDGLAAADDKNTPNSPEISVVWDWENFDGINADDNISNRLDINFDDNISLDAYNCVEDSRYEDNSNFDQNLGYDGEDLADGANLFDRYDMPLANVDGDIK